MRGDGTINTDGRFEEAAVDTEPSLDGGSSGASPSSEVFEVGTPWRARL